MSAFIIETSLETRNPHEIHLFGPATDTKQQLSGKVNLVVFKPVQLKQLFVTFLAEVTVDFATLVVVAKSDPVPICRVDFQAIDKPTHFKPGTFSYPFTLSLPSDLPTTDCTKLKDQSLTWKYEIQTCAIPTGLFARRKMVHEEVKLKRFHVIPSDSASLRCTGKRPNAFECSLDGPKFVSCQDKSVRINAFLHPYSNQFRVKSLEASVTQTEVIRFESKLAQESLESIRSLLPTAADFEKRLAEKKAAKDKSVTAAPLVDTNNTKTVSNVVTILHPDQEEFSTAWGREHPVEFDIELLPSELQPTEDLGWVHVKHGVRITVHFVDPTVKSFSVVAPIQFGRTLDVETWAFQGLLDHDLHPPDYGVDVEHSTLLDSNTSRVMGAQLHRELYPEREPVVPDMTDSLPPMYEDDADQPTPYSAEK